MKTWFSEHKKSVLLSTAATLLPIVIGCILWNRLPSSIGVLMEQQMVLVAKDLRFLHRRSFWLS